MVSNITGVMIPSDYSSPLDIRETEKAIKTIKDYFEHDLANQLNLTRVSAPLFVRPQSGMNDNLNGTERPVAFDVRSMDGEVVEVVHSLAKWKRVALKRYGFSVGEGLYTDMNAIRRDEEADNLHSIYVDQWDWEVIIAKEDRNEETLKSTVRKIYQTLKDTESLVNQCYPMILKTLPTDIFFITSQELEDRYPKLSPKDREDAICKEKKAVFIMKIGGLLNSGIKHDGRAPDYDDWTLNGDIIVWFNTLERAFELSSMGIRVDETALDKQLSEAGMNNRRTLLFHLDLLNGNLPYTIGGGIGQSRLCMFFLQKAHIGEVQASVWSDEMITICGKANINLL